STLVFAALRAQHIAITPNQDEIDRIRNYALHRKIDVKTVEFVCACSDAYLPTCKKSELDVVFIDGKHAFPWPIVDWFYTADLLRKDGLLIIDDLQLRPVSILVEFLQMDT